MLDEIAEDFGGASAAVREGIRMLADQRRRQQALGDLLDEMNERNGPADPDDVEEMVRRHFDSGADGTAPRQADDC